MQGAHAASTLELSSFGVAQDESTLIEPLPESYPHRASDYVALWTSLMSVRSFPSLTTIATAKTTLCTSAVRALALPGIQTSLVTSIKKHSLGQNLPAEARFLVSMAVEGRVVSHTITFTTPDPFDDLTEFRREVTDLSAGFDCGDSARNTISGLLGLYLQHVERKGIVALLSFEGVSLLPTEQSVQLHVACSRMMKGTAGRAHRVYVVWTDRWLDPEIPTLATPASERKPYQPKRFNNVKPVMLTNDTVKAVAVEILTLNTAWVCTILPCHVSSMLCHCMSV